METSDNLMKVDDPNSGFLSAAELVQIRKTNEEPTRSNIGEKFYIRQNNWLESEAVECALENFTDSLKQNRAARKCDLMQAEWNEELNVSITSKLKGKFLQHMGCAYDGKIALSPEESIFLLENGCIEILNGEMPLSTEEAYNIMLKEDLSAEKYHVYSQLSQLGFIVVAHQKSQSAKTMDLRKHQAKRKRKSSTEMYKEPEKKRTSFLGAFSNLPDTTVHSAKEGNSVPKSASAIRTVAADSVSQECITIARTPSPSADNEVPKSSTTHPNKTISSEKCSIITDPEVPTVITVENSNYSSMEDNAKVVEEELAPSPLKDVREFVSNDQNESGGHTLLPSAKRTIEGDDPRLPDEGSKNIHIALSDKTISEKEISVQSEHSNLDPCCSSSNQAAVSVSEDGSKEIDVTVNKNEILSSKETSVLIEDSESCCHINSNPALSNFEASVSVNKEGNEEKNNTQECNKVFSSKEISVLIEDSESCNDTYSNPAPSNFKAAVSIPEEGNKEINISLNKSEVFSKEVSESCGFNSSPAPSNFKVSVGASGEKSKEINITVNNNQVLSPKEIFMEIEDSESCDSDSNPAPSNFTDAVSVSKEGSKEINNAQENITGFSSKEISVLIEDSESCNDTYSNPAPSNFKAAVSIPEEGNKEINISINKSEVSSKEISVQIEDSESCGFNSSPAPSNFKVSVGASGEKSKEINITVNNNQVFSPEEIFVEIEDSESCDSDSNPAPSNFTDAVSVSKEGSKEINNAKENKTGFSSKEIPVQIEDSESCDETNSNPAPSNFEATVKVSNNAIDILNLDYEDTEISCSSESSGNNVYNSNNNEDWRMDARRIYEESNSDVMSCSSNDDDILSVGDEKLEDDEVELVAVTKKEIKPLAVIDLLTDEESKSEYSGSDDEIQVVKVCEGVRSNDRQNPRSSVIHSTIKCKKEEKPSGSDCRSLQVKFPNCARQNMVVVSRPPSMYLPPNVVLSKECYTLTFAPCQAQAQRVWNSYRDMQEYQMSQRHNQRTEAFSSRNSRSNFHRSRFDSSGGYDSNSWSRNSASDQGVKQPFTHPWANLARRNSPQGFPNLSPWSDRNPIETQNPELRSSNRRSSNLNEPMQNPSASPFNLLPNFPNQFRYPPPNATAINSVVSVSNQDMNVSMVGNHILHPSRPPLLPGFDGDLDGERRMDLMAAVQRTAYSVATDVLSSMLGSHMNPHMLPPIPPYGAFPPAQNGGHSLGMLPPLNPPMGAHNFNREPPLSNRRREQLRRNRTSNPFPCQYRNISSRRSWTEVREAVGEQDMELDVGSDVEEVPLNPTDVLWDPEGICPLVKPGTKFPPAEILKKLQVTKMANLRSNTSSNQVSLSNTCSLEISFDVYLPGTNYRKTSPGVPKHRIIVVRSTDLLPKYADIVFLQKKWNDGATLQLAVVDNGDISFQSFNNVCLTVLIPHEM